MGLEDTVELRFREVEDICWIHRARTMISKPQLRQPYVRGNEAVTLCNLSRKDRDKYK